MFKGLKVVIVAGALLIIAAAVFRQFGVRSASAAPTTSIPRDTTTVDRGDVALTITTTGNIQAIQNVDLAFAASGTVAAVNIKAGDYVLKGQTIAALDDQSALDAIAAAQEKVNDQQLALEKLTAKPRQVDIDVAQANVNLAQATLNESQIGPTDSLQIQIAQLNVQLAQNQLWQAQLARDISNQRATKTKPLNSTAVDANNKSINSATTNVTIAQDQLNATRSQGANVGSIDAAKTQLLSAQQQLQTLLTGPDPKDVQQAQDNLAAAQEALASANQALNDTKLMAPFDGLVAQINLSAGQASAQSSSTTPAVVLLDVSKFYVDVPVAELDIAKIKLNQVVSLRFDALPGAALNGTVSQIATTPNTGTPVTYTVRIVFSPAGQPLLSTMSTTANIVTSSATNVIRLPNRFIRQDSTTNQTYANVRKADGTFQNVPIQLGAANDSYTEVTSGLNVGDVVAAPTVSGGGQGAGGGRGGPGGGPGAAGGILRAIGG